MKDELHLVQVGNRTYHAENYIKEMEYKKT